ncbi:MAG: MFS transporter [Thermoprotei archaeon]
MISRKLFLVSSTTASFVTPFTLTAVNIALPSIARTLNIDIASINWFANVFLITMASTILLFGIIADWIGRERVFLVGTVIYATLSLLIPFLKDFRILLILRCFQGLGSSMVSGTAVAILATLFPEKKGFVIGINTAAVYIGILLGPSLGGFFANYVGWEAIFVFTGITMLVSSTLALLSLDLTRRASGRKPYLETLVLFIVSMILITTGSAYVVSIYGISALLIGLTTFIATMYIEYRKSFNLVKQIFEKAVFLAYLVALFSYAATFSFSILYSKYLQLFLGFTPFQAGLLLMVQPVFQVLLSPLAGFLADKKNPGVLVVLGVSLITCGLGISLLTYREPILQTIPLALMGVGFAFFASPNTTQIIRRMPREAYASASAFLGSMRFTGQSLSTSILTTLETMYRASILVNTALTTYLVLALTGLVLAIASVYSRK